MPASAAEPIKIGYVGGISGACGGLTHSARKAMEIAQAEINSAGGVLGRPIEIIWRDSKTKPDEGAKQARDLILSEKVDLLTGVCSSSVFMAINPVAKQYGVPLFSAISGTHKATIDFGHPFVFQTQPHTLMEGEALAEYAARGGWKNIVTMGLDYEWGTHHRQGLHRGAAEARAGREDRPPALAPYRRLDNLLAHYFEYWQLVIGLILVVVVLVSPSGIAGFVHRAGGWRRRRKAA